MQHSVFLLFLGHPCLQLVVLLDMRKREALLRLLAARARCPLRRAPKVRATDLSILEGC